MMRETSYGVIPLRKGEGGEWMVLIIRHTKGGFWSFPKGHGESQETPHAAAIRELYEETHLTVTRFLDEAQLSETYHFHRHNQLISKTVHYFVAEVEGVVAMQPGEVEEALWIKLKEAENYITYAESRTVAIRARELIESKSL